MKRKLELSKSYPHLSIAKHYHMPYSVVLLMADAIKEGRFTTLHHFDALAYVTQKCTVKQRDEIFDLITAIHKEVSGSCGFVPTRDSSPSYR